MPTHKKYQDLTNIEEKEKYVSKLIKKHHDDQLRDRWESMVEKKAPAELNRIKKNSLTKILLAAISIGILIFALSKMTFKEELGPQHFALQELEEPLLHPGLTKGVNPDNTTRTQAIVSYNAQVFDIAAKGFTEIENKTTEDRFYLAMSHLYLKEYDTAVKLLTTLSTEASDLKQEASWYLAMAYILKNDTESSKEVLNSISNNEWKYVEANNLLDILN